MVTDKLPSKFSALIRLALVDLDCVLRKPEPYRIEMSRWHVPNDGVDGKTCEVCLAGAIMACTLNVPWGRHATPNQLRDKGAITRHDCQMLRALDYLRVGDWYSAANRMDQIDSTYADKARKFRELTLHRLYLTPYHINPEAFKQEFMEIADRLEVAGL